MMTPHDLVLALGALGVILTVTSDLMPRMVPLRILALLANITFAFRSTLAHDWIDIALQASLFCINGYRLWDLRRLLDEIERVNADTPLQDWLLPYMKKKNFKGGTTLFRKGDIANHMVYVREGTVRIVEANHSLGAGSLVGEIGLFTHDRRRTATIVCETKCVCYTMTDEAIHLLYYQNPKLGFFLIRLIVQRLVQDLERRPDEVPA